MIMKLKTNQLPESYIDMKVRKKFNDGKIYDGEVIKYDKKIKWFMINYFDGDAEEVNLIELKIKVIYKK